MSVPNSQRQCKDEPDPIYGIVWCLIKGACGVTGKCLSHGLLLRRGHQRKIQIVPNERRLLAPRVSLLAGLSSCVVQYPLLISVFYGGEIYKGTADLY